MEALNVVVVMMKGLMTNQPIRGHLCLWSFSPMVLEACEPPTVVFAATLRHTAILWPPLSTGNLGSFPGSPLPLWREPGNEATGTLITLCIDTLRQFFIQQGSFCMRQHEKDPASSQ